MVFRPLAAAAFAALLLAAPAHAQTVTAKRVNVDTYTSCFLVMPVAGGGIECSSTALPDTGELDPYVALHRHGRVHVGERGDYPGFPGRNVRLRDGDVWKIAGVTCRVKDRTITCRNQDRHGFRLGTSSGFSRF
jgi:hypothetical protein